ncbi:MAG: prephenate dehydrogenase [Candidatus Omnitrophica bacterium]|jgi:prephenate dehydrogenase|nr:prephenate dehydrogenase [Candidatus Omnitrophota bacterium]MDD5252457.1 prephenate dehydrogenase [Candidatus Omnitrophota bacterium]
MKLFNKTVIIGTGLIGGSLGLDLKKKHLVSMVTGFSRHKSNVELAKKSGAIDCIGSSLEVVKDADLIILAMPPEANINFALKIAKKIKNDCIVIDVGSTKREIVSKINRVIANFIGCHPLSGSEKKGATNISAGIFKDSVCIVTPSARVNKKALNRVCLLWRKLGSKVVILSPEKHDQVLAFTSHLPHVVAFSLINAIPDQFLTLSSGGLRDTTRISASDANLWSEVFLSNRKNILFCLTAFQKKLAALKLALERKNRKLLTNILSAANKKREKLG